MDHAATNTWGVGSGVTLGHSQTLKIWGFVIRVVLGVRPTRGGGGGASRSQSALHMHILVCICSNVEAVQHDHRYDTRVLPCYCLHLMALIFVNTAVFPCWGVVIRVVLGVRPTRGGGGGGMGGWVRGHKKLFFGGEGSD